MLLYFLVSKDLEYSFYFFLLVNTTALKGFNCFKLFLHFFNLLILFYRSFKHKSMKTGMHGNWYNECKNTGINYFKLKIMYTTIFFYLLLRLINITQQNRHKNNWLSQAFS